MLHSENQCGIYGKCSTTEPIERTDEPLNIYKKVNTAALATNNGFENVIIQKIPAPVIQSLPTVVQAPPVVQALPARPPANVPAIPAQASAVVQEIPAPVVQIQTSDAALIQTSSETFETIETSDASGTCKSKVFPPPLQVAKMSVTNAKISVTKFASKCHKL